MKALVWWMSSLILLSLSLKRIYSEELSIYKYISFNFFLYFSSISLPISWCKRLWRAHEHCRPFFLCVSNQRHFQSVKSQRSQVANLSGLRCNPVSFFFQKRQFTFSISHSLCTMYRTIKGFESTECLIQKYILCYL